MNRLTNTTQWLRVREVSVVWVSAQRQIDDRKVAKIAAHFDPDAFGVIAVCPVAGGSRYHCIDGQHRLAAVQSLYGDDERVPCVVLPENTPQHAAHVWTLMNTGRTSPSAIDKFLVAVQAGHEPQISISQAVSELGLAVGHFSSTKTIMAPAALIDIYRRGGDALLRRTLVVCRRFWQAEPGLYEAAVLRGLSMFLKEHGDGLDELRLGRTVGKNLTPHRLIGKAKSAREFNGGSIADNVAQVLVREYDTGLRAKNKLARAS